MNFFKKLDKDKKNYYIKYANKIRTMKGKNINEKNCYFCDYYGYWVTKEICLHRHKKGKKFCSLKCKHLILLIQGKNAN